MARLCDVIDPNNPTGPKIKAILEDDYVRQLSPVRFQNLWAAQHVLENTLCIFSGVREHNRGGWCYTGRPDSWCIKEGTTTPFPAHLIFAVYLEPSMRIYAHRAEYVDPEDPDSPVDWQTRYRGRPWKRNS